jgi:hypothetical protein
LDVVIVRVEVPAAGLVIPTGFGEKDPVIPVGVPLTVNVTLPENPPEGVTVTVNVVVPEGRTCWLDGEALSEKSGAVVDVVVVDVVVVVVGTVVVVVDEVVVVVGTVVVVVTGTVVVVVVVGIDVVVTVEVVVVVVVEDVQVGNLNEPMRVCQLCVLVVEVL